MPCSLGSLTHTPQQILGSTGQRSFAASLGSLYHYQARWYSPVVGMFLSPDPLVPEPGNPQGLRGYAYSLKNPLRYTRPGGYACIERLLSSPLGCRSTVVQLVAAGAGLTPRPPLQMLERGSTAEVDGLGPLWPPRCAGGRGFPLSRE